MSLAAADSVRNRMSSSVFEFDVHALQVEQALEEQTTRLTKRLLSVSRTGPVQSDATSALSSSSAIPSIGKRFGKGVGKKGKVGASRDSASAAHSQNRVVVLQEDVLTSCEETLHARAHANAGGGVVVKEGQTEKLHAATGKLEKRWLVLTATHLELRASQEAKPETGKVFPLVSCVIERAPPKLSNQNLLEIISVNKPVVVNFPESSHASEWILAIMQTRLACIKKLIDWCQPFRLLTLMVGKAGPGARATVMLDDAVVAAVGIGAGLGVGGGGGTIIGTGVANASHHEDRRGKMLDRNVETYRRAFLEYGRLTVHYEIASQMHGTYISDVEKRLERLDSLTKEREKLRQDIAELEVSLASCQGQAQLAGRELSERFGSVLSSVRTLRDSVSQTHGTLRSKMDSVRLQGVDFNSAGQLHRFRQGVHVLEVGVAMETPMKLHLQELEAREEHTSAEVKELESRKEQLANELKDVTQKAESLSNVLARAASLQRALEEAAQNVSSHSAESLEWVDSCKASVDGFIANNPLLMQNAQLMKVLGRAGPFRGRRSWGPTTAAGVSLGGAFEALAQQQREEDGEATEDLLAGTLGGATNAHKASSSAISHPVGGAQGSSEALDESDTPASLVNRVLYKHSGSLESIILYCFEYFMKPVQLWEQLSLTYCSGPSLMDDDATTAEIEHAMATVRVRTLNVLRKWAELQPYHFRENKQLQNLLKNFLTTVRLVGHDKTASMIEAELFGDVVKESVAKELAPPIFKEGFEDPSKIVMLAHTTPEEMARQICLIDHALYKRLQVREFLKQNFMKRAAELAPNLKAFTAQFNVMAGVVSSSILGCFTISDRSRMITYWIRVMMHLKELHNFASVIAIVGGLTVTPVNRLKATWALVAPDFVEFFRQCNELMDKNFAKLRALQDVATPPAIPYCGVYQRDLVYLEEAPTMKGENVNLNKLKSVSTVIQNCLHFQKASYWFDAVPQIQALVLEMPLLSENELHERSLEAEPRIPEGGAATQADDAAASSGSGNAAGGSGSSGGASSGSSSSSAAAAAGASTSSGSAGRLAKPTEGTSSQSTSPVTPKKVVNRFASMKDEDLPRLPTFPPPLTDREEYKEYMQLKYEYQKRGLNVHNAVGFKNVAPLQDGGGFLAIPNQLEDSVKQPELKGASLTDPDLSRVKTEEALPRKSSDGTGSNHNSPRGGAGSVGGASSVYGAPPPVVVSSHDALLSDAVSSGSGFVTALRKRSPHVSPLSSPAGSPRGSVNFKSGPFLTPQESGSATSFVGGHRRKVSQEVPTMTVTAAPAATTAATTRVSGSGSAPTSPRSEPTSPTNKPLPKPPARDAKDAK